jgi:indolepyruvate ferredoxin oxidoreductase alpha subunit
MTGHQENPGSGYTLKGEPATMIDIATMVNACGIKNIRTVNPNELDTLKEAIEWGINLPEPAVLITRWPCVLKKMSQEDKNEFPEAFKQVAKVDVDACIGCKKCLKSGCPALAFDIENKKSGILADMCVGCGVCAQICPKQAIKVEAR